MSDKVKQWTLAAVGFLTVVSIMHAQERMTIERLYSLPRLIGTAPKGFSWSADSKRLAFLWNDEGTHFYDVWTLDVADEKLQRRTSMPRRSAEPVVDTHTATLEQLQAPFRVEQDPGVTAAIWHPDGKRLLLTFRGDLYLSDTGSAAAEPVRLTEIEGPERRASFSPDGRFLTYLHGGDLWLVSSEGRDPRKLVGNDDLDITISSYRWSPDGQAIAFLELDRRNVPIRNIPDYLTEESKLVRVHRPFPGEEPPSRRLGVVSLDPTETHWLDLDAKPQEPIFSYRWSPEGRRLLVDRSDLYVKDRRIRIIDVETGKGRDVYREADPENVTAYWQSEWAPDGKGIYFLSDKDEDYHIYLLPESRITPKRITQGDWAVARFTVSAETSSLYFVANEGRPEERHIYRIGVGGQQMRRLSRSAGTHSPTYSPDGRHAAVLFSSDEMPPELMLTSLHSSREATVERRITTSPLPEFDDYRWVQPEYVTFKSHIDGTDLTGRLTLPPNLDRTKTYPAILGSVYSNTVRNQWGGRTAHPTWGLDQYLVQEGYVLLNVNFRGSWGNGKALRRGIRLDYGGIDVEDLHSGVKYLESLGFVDMDRVGIWGSSYGGLLTCMSLFKKPGVYNAGVAGAPATNVWHAMTGEMRVMMAPYDHSEEYRDSSAFTHAAGLRDHLMIIHGMRDRIVLYKDSVSLVERLMMMGKDVDFVTLPNSGHGWDTEGSYQTIFAFNKLVGHFERYLGKGPR
jgi:dipeptidyl-peptidase-4